MQNEEITHLLNKLEQLGACMRGNRAYKQKLQTYKEEGKGKLSEIEEMLAYHKEKKKISMLTKFNDSSPHINFYNYDTVCQARPRIIYLMRMLDKSVKVNTKDTTMMDKLINISTSSENSSSEDYEDYACDKSQADAGEQSPGASQSPKSNSSRRVLA